MVAAWQAVLERLKDEAGERNFKTWIEPIQCKQDERGVRLEVSAPFFKDWVTRYYLASIKEELLRHSPDAGDVRVVVAAPRRDSAAKPSRATGSATGPRRQPATRKTASSAGRRPVRIGRLMPHYTFDRFVVGPSNEIAYGAASAVANGKGEAFNPLFLWGGVGLGKTHLICAVAHHFAAQGAARRVAFLSAEEFMNQMIGALREDKMKSFRERFRELDLLIVDDVEFLAGKERTQEEFFHTFDALYTAGKQIVLTSDKPPQEIPDLAQRLRSRFEGGLNADIQPPTPETRMKIVKRKAADQKVPLSDELARIIVERSGPSVRELEGALTRVLAWTELHGGKLDAKAVRGILKPMAPRTVRVSFAQVLSATSRYFRVPTAELRSHARDRATSEARQIAMFLCRSLTDLPYSAIGKEFGGRDHSTVVYAVNTIDKRRTKDARLDVTLAALERTLREEAATRAA